MWSSAPKPDVAVTVNEKSPLQTSAARDERNPFSQQWSQNVKLLGDYCRNALTGDVIAGITVASVLVPQSMAYALLAGLPPEMGLYSSLLPLVAYAAFGSSPHLAVGPVSVVCVLIAVQMAEMNLPEEEGPMISIMMALMAGVVLCLLGVAKLGFVACLLSHAVLSGFMTAVAFIIASEQLDTFLGFKVDVQPLGEADFAAEKEKGEQRRLKLTCPQRPGLVLAMTELLKDHTCKMSSISADTMAKGDEIWFEIEAIIDVPAGVDPDEIESSLRLWTSSAELRATLIFDTYLHNTQSLSHA